MRSTPAFSPAGLVASVFLRCVFIGLLSIGPALAEPAPLSIKFSKKHQVRTGMIWIQLKPNLVLAGATGAEEVWHGGDGTRRDVSYMDLAVEGSTDQLPYSAVGKLFFTRDGGKVGSCSAAFAGGPEVIVTAAHCVMNEFGEWHSDFLFIRSYGLPEQDIYAVQCVSVPGEWGELVNDGLLDFDYAFLRTNRPSKGGSLGITNGPPPEEINIVGYSDNFHASRRLLQLETPVMLASSGRIRSDANPLGVGSSGAPWLDLSTVYSVTSHFKADEDDMMWGARLTSRTMALIRYTRNGCAHQAAR